MQADRCKFCAVKHESKSNVAPANLLQYLAPENASLTEKREAELQRIMGVYQRFEGDTGSSEVQGATLCMPTLSTYQWQTHQATSRSFVEKIDALFVRKVSGGEPAYQKLLVPHVLRPSACR